MHHFPTLNEAFLKTLRQELHNTNNTHKDLTKFLRICENLFSTNKLPNRLRCKGAVIIILKNKSNTYTVLFFSEKRDDFLPIVSVNVFSKDSKLWLNNINKLNGTFGSFTYNGTDYTVVYRTKPKNKIVTSVHQNLPEKKLCKTKTFTDFPSLTKSPVNNVLLLKSETFIKKLTVM